MTCRRGAATVGPSKHCGAEAARHDRAVGAPLTHAALASTGCSSARELRAGDTTGPNSAFQTTIISWCFRSLQKVAHWLAGPVATTGSRATTLSILIVAIVALILGSLADRTPIKKKLLAVFLGLGVTATARCSSSREWLSR